LTARRSPLMAMQVGDVVQETMAIITGRRKKNKKKNRRSFASLNLDAGCRTCVEKMRGC
jgi:hypothetical protein